MPNTEAIGNTLEAIRHTDIYLIDLILKRSFSADMKILDAGCGMGRNSEYFIQNGYDVFGADISEDDINYLSQHASSVNPSLADGHFRVEALENMSFLPESMDVVICSAVFHFARDEAHFRPMLQACWKALKPGGIFFSRLATTIGIEDQVKPLGHRRYILPDGSQRFLADEKMILDLTGEMNGVFLEPLKTVLVHHKRSMTNWILKKH